MISRTRDLLIPFLALLAVHTEAAAGKMEPPPVEVRSTVEGAYDVFKAGDRIGRESFVQTTLSNNTVIHESVFEVFEGEGILVSGNNRLEVEEDTGFPRSYYTHRRTRGPEGETVREVKVEMYANVAAVSERQDEKSRSRNMALPTGCLFVEGNTARHLAVVLDRYDRRSGGRQSFRAFDPLGVAVTDVTLESAGDTTLTLGAAVPAPGASPAGGGARVERFRYRAGRAASIDFFVDGEGRIARIDTGASDYVYDLVSIEERAGGAKPAGVSDPR